MKQLPPLTLERRLDSRIWGGNRLAPWMGLSQAPSPLAEIWLVYADLPVIAPGLPARTLGELAALHGPDLLGTTPHAQTGEEFPLLAKLIDAADHLSLQVHPDDAFALRYEAASGFRGKTEAWHILSTQPNAEVLHGWNQHVDRALCEQALREQCMLSLVRRVAVRPGDTVYVPAGTIHAINAGVMLFEIQQRSDLTYRLYDYGRPRELQIEQALRVLDYAPSPAAITPPQRLSSTRTLLVQSQFFAMERWTLSAPTACTSDPRSFDIFTVVDGHVRFECASASHTLSCGSALVVPASLGQYRLVPAPHASLLRCYVP